MVKRYLLTGLVAGFLSISSTLYAGESEIILKDNTTASGLTVKEETANTTIARFRGDGMVGIGTANPGFRLTVDGTGNEIYCVMSEDGTQIPDNFTIQLAPGGGTAITRLGYIMGNFGNSLGLLVGNGRNGPLRFAAGNGLPEWMRIDTAGNVGIGTTAPLEKLHVASGSIRVDSLIRFGNGSPDNAALTIASGKIALHHFAASPTQVMTIDSSGKVGIGTTAPTERLEVLGNIKASGAVTQGSSREIKKNISLISTQEAMEALEGLNPVRFEYKADASGEEHLGFIAENVPELVAEQDRKHLNPMDLTAVLVKVVQEQQWMLQDQKETIDAMKQEIEILKSGRNSGVKGL